jgi:predicted lipase
MIDVKSLLRSAHYAADAYLEHNDLCHHYDGTTDTVTPFEYKKGMIDVQGYVLNCEHDVTIVFRGSESVQDWITDATVTQVETPIGKIHKGFYESWKSIETVVKEIVHIEEKKRIWIVGHSLGAAIATVCAASYVNGGYNVHRVVTMGSPKVGNDEFVEFYDSHLGDRTARIRNNNDVVTDIPDVPGSRSETYKHVAPLYYLDRKGILHTSSTSKFRAFDKLIGFFMTPVVDPITDHFMDNYIQALECNCH